MSRESEHFLAAPKIAYAEYSIASFRPCPECGQRLSTNGNGRFLCQRCLYQDEQIEEVAKIKATGLAYASKGPNTNNRLFVKKSRGYRTDEDTREAT
jgi:ribosomal protein S27AE